MLTSINALLPAPPYKLMKMNSACNPVTSLASCSAAAVSLGLADTTASDDGQNGASFDPPYCYFENGKLKFNSNGKNTGSCSSSDQCVCKAQGK